MEIGSTLRRLRKMRGFHQDSFAALCGLAQGYLSQIENDRREPSFAVLNRISQHLEVPVPIIIFLSMQEKDVVLGKNDILKQFKTIINDFTLRYSTKEYKLPNHLQSILGFPNNQLVEIANSTDKYYREFRKKKLNKNGQPKLKNGEVQYRTLQEVKEPLKTIQKKIKEKILVGIELSEAAYGGVKGRSNILNAEKHLGKKYGFVTDLRNFYPSVRSGRIYDLFISLSFPPDIARLLTMLTTKDGGLPQGTSTSPYLANIIFIPTDIILLKYCKKHRIVYTRFVDDLTFTAQYDFQAKTYELIAIIVNGGFEINHQKTHYKVGPMTITGVIRKNNVMEAPDYIVEKLVSTGLKIETKEGLARYALNINKRHAAAREILRNR